jgi:prepilin-type N-terminal cleavage/methylation domain-containing protein/prepilin-type processing-associated H-X9-DG protein
MQVACHRASPVKRGFTLVELLVVIGVLVLLLSLLLPALARARAQARSVRCASNMRQLCQGLLCYVAQNKQRFPPNVSFPSPGQFWYQRDRWEGMLTPTPREQDGVFTCPEDPEAVRSYSMNVWMSSEIDGDILRQTPVPGRLWGSSLAGGGSHVILLIESWSNTADIAYGYSARPIVGFGGDSPGRRFGAGGGIGPIDMGRWGLVNSEVSFRRHRPANSPARGNEPVGAVNIGYADGHVELKASEMLIRPGTTLSTLDSLWSPLDFEQNR